MEIVPVAVILWIVSIFVAHAIGKPKNRAGWIYGLLLSWLGVFIVALLPAAAELTLEDLETMRRPYNQEWYEETKAELTAARSHRECPFCKEKMRRDASVCPHCRHESPAWTFDAGRWWTTVDGARHVFVEVAGTWERVDGS